MINPIAESMTRRIEIDGWIFEVKMVRALKVANYGEPYCAIANLSLQGEIAYVDGCMDKEQGNLKSEDYLAMERFCEKMEIKKITFESDERAMFSSEKVDINSMFDQERPNHRKFG